MFFPRTAVALVTVFLAACNPNTPETPGISPVPPATSSQVTGIAPKNAIVTLLPAAGESPMPKDPAVLDQISKQFLPRTLLVRVGQPVEFRNSDDMPHNVSVLRRETGSEIFNVGSESHQTYVHTFDRVGQFDVRCDIHEGMEATVIVSRGPMTTIAADDGSFSIPNVAFGSYNVSMTFNGQTVDHPLDVAGPRTEFKLTR
ncbi:MAG TPA: plastocyanin/azurin family copper-binding protein [Vicinamibacterales bacterium]|nr:plastocyanin/azurin family copper-binding protein [Vicinamibacterales bacterium]